MIYIYEKNNLQIIDVLNYTVKEFNSNPKKCYPSWDNSKLIVSKTKYKYPKLDNNILREKTEKELKLEKIVQLVPGEYIQDNQVIKVENPNNLILPIWSAEEKRWEEGTTEEGLIEEQDRILQEYKEKLFLLGYNWNGHCQKVRPKDIALLESVISSKKLAIEKGIKKQDDTTNWYFNRNDMVKLKLEDFYNLKLAGISFVQEVYDVEASFKEEIRINITFEEFLLKFNSNKS